MTFSQFIKIEPDLESEDESKPFFINIKPTKLEVIKTENNTDDNKNDNVDDMLDIEMHDIKNILDSENTNTEVPLFQQPNIHTHFITTRKKNPIWDYFIKCASDPSKAQCIICSKAYSLGSDKAKNQTITGLKSHLSKIHSDQNSYYLKRVAEYEIKRNDMKKKCVKAEPDVITYMKSTVLQLMEPAGGAAHSQWPDDHEVSRRIDKAIMDLIIVDMLPYSLVEGSAFKQLNFSDPLGLKRYRFKTEKLFRTNLMPATYDKVMTHITNLISKAEWITFTTDIWSNSTKSYSLMTFTAHFILWPQRLKAILGAIVLQEDQSGAYLADKLIELMHKFEINSKIYLVIQNPFNIGSATHIADFTVLGCVAHTLQLAINDAIFVQENNKSIIKKIRKVVRHFKRNEQSNIYLSKCQDTCALPNNSLILDIETQWNSTYLMLERIFEQKNAINLYSVERGGLKLPNNLEWDLVEHIVKILKCFYEATLDISTDEACISLIIPLVEMLEGKLQKITKNDTENAAEEMIEKLQASMNKRFYVLKNTSYLITATILDPRFKTKYLTADEIETGKKEICNFLLKKMHSSMTVPETLPSIDSPASTSIAVPQTVKESTSSLWDYHDNSTTNIGDSLPEEEIPLCEQALLSYLREPRL